ncbi:MAG: class I SAM-dependent methyltransferase [Solirubrobacterales bacterium]
MTPNHQQEHYGRDYDYSKGSPHLRYQHLYESLTGRIKLEVEQATEPGRTAEVLEIGAGDGSVTTRLLELGYSVTGTEMSEDSVAAMKSRFSGNEGFRALLDAEGDLEVLGGDRFNAVLFASVLHHIPDYLASLKLVTENHLEPGASLISIQDPLWYPRQSRFTNLTTRLAYLSWRVTQGEFLRGVKTRLGRLRRGISEESAGDVIEYHVVRDGVDELAISEQLKADFESVEIHRYWSSQGPPQQWLGERLGLVNTFAIFASGYRPQDQNSPAG